jgi:hypothetical protein
VAPDDLGHTRLHAPEFSELIVQTLRETLAVELHVPTDELHIVGREDRADLVRGHPAAVKSGGDPSALMVRNAGRIRPPRFRTSNSRAGRRPHPI